MDSIVANFLYVLSGLIISNGAPHLINGLSGRYWPRKSRLTKKVEKAYQEKSLTSTPVANVIWGLSNILIACIMLFKAGDFKLGINLNSLSLFFGLLIGAIYIAWNFTDNNN
jgi:hypothetical protein